MEFFFMKFSYLESYMKLLIEISYMELKVIKLHEFISRTLIRGLIDKIMYNSTDYT